jgi:aminoglycoside phosphotransferase (APT) family kinase protein
MLMGMHEDQLAIDNKIVRRLIDGQLPQWRSLPVRQVPATGTVHAIFRMGNDLAAPVPAACAGLAPSA